ncbi:hypothetical protein [Kitasatospora sp. A2-31]|uniref:WXG100-like domain-containing protein n=1 Tax=Kitasatospora sp. A2-31 TaxID=2916414 RepID=UPI001EE8A587|nr:hypothetical protein [Kitasatospora sp. A2-31]MCG6493143.1 hypothetical protein [Kitasatospora sp. A2-31]
MIELPADLAAVLTTLRSHENGAGIAFPDADEDRLAELARAWDTWNTAAEPRVRAIVASAQQAAAHMSGPAADGFRQYLEKFAGRDDTHAVTVLESGLAMARCLHEASGTVGRTKTAMVQQLRSTKEYLDGSMPGAAPAEAARSEGVGLAVDSCRHYVGQASADVDSMLRRNAGSVDRMDSAGQACALAGAGGPGAGAGGTDAGGPGAGTGGGTGGDARPVLAGLGAPEVPRTGSLRAEVLDREGGTACRPGGAAVPGLNLAGFTGAGTGTGAQGGLSAGGAADPAGAGGASSSVLGPGGAAGAGGAGGLGGPGGRRAGVGGSAGRARAGAVPSFAGAGLGLPSGTAAAAAAGSRAGAGGHGPSGTTRQPSGAGASGTGVRAGAGASAVGAGVAGRGPVPGGLHAPGRGGGKKGIRGRRRPDLVVGQAPEQDEAVSDDAVHGPAAEARPGDRQEQRAHRRWLDDARTEAGERRPAEAPQAAAAGAEPPPDPAADLLTQLTSVVLGPDAGTGGRPGEGTTGTAGGAVGTGGAEAASGRTEGRSAAPAAHLRGVVGAAPAGAVGGAQAGPEAGGRPAPLREEGGYQVPSPQLRAALAKLAAAGEFDRPAPGGAARQPAARGDGPVGGRTGNDE